MWSRRSLLKVLGVGAALSALGGCGFRPLYGRSGGVDLSETLSRVEIGPVRNIATEGRDVARVAQQLRNVLLEGLAPRGAGGEQIYFLKVDISEGISSLAVQKSADATRADLSLSASYNLFDQRTGQPVLTGTSRAISSFNILNSEFATLMAEKGARDRAVRQLGDAIRLKVAGFGKTHAGGN